NSSGYKLNQQELRNAEYFGEFKTTVQSLATEQLHRWRAWGVFDADKVARMNEVELSSELVMLMLNGVTEKSERVISKAYNDFDDEFKEKIEVGKRFRAVCDAIDERFGAVMSGTFSKRTVFYALFGGVYKTMFGFGKEWKLSTRRRKHLTAPEVEGMITAGKKIASKTAPQ